MDDDGETRALIVKIFLIFNEVGDENTHFGQYFGVIGFNDENSTFW
jgi:hypothetical protein